MTIRKLGGFRFLPDRFARSLAPAFADRLPVTHGGMARVLWELATGENPVAGDPPATPYNPQGELGVDRSGPPWGPAPRHTIAHAGGRRPGSFSRSNGNSFILSLPADRPRQRLCRGVAHSVAATNTPFDFGWEIWNRPYHTALDGLPSPYSRGYVRVSAYLGSAGSASVSIRGGRFGSEFEDQWRRSSFTVTSTTPAMFLTDFYIDLLPGLNEVDFEFEVTSGPAVFIERLEIQQQAKLNH